MPNTKTIMKFGATGALAVLGSRAATALLGTRGGPAVQFIAQIAGGAAGAWAAAKFIG